MDGSNKGLAAMKVLDRDIRHILALGVGVLAALCGATAGAQENLYANKTAAQIFASDCAICHKTPQGLSKAGGMFGLGMESFLREHYTASRESAAAIARYIQAMDTGPAPEKGARRAKSGAKPSAKKLPDTKPAEVKAGDGSTSASKPADKKTEPVETEAKPEPKAQPEAKIEAKPSEPKPAEPAKPEKSD